MFLDLGRGRTRQRRSDEGISRGNAQACTICVCYLGTCLPIADYLSVLLFTILRRRKKKDFTISRILGRICGLQPKHRRLVFPILAYERGLRTRIIGPLGPRYQKKTKFWRYYPMSILLTIFGQPNRDVGNTKFPPRVQLNFNVASPAFTSSKPENITAHGTAFSADIGPGLKACAGKGCAPTCLKELPTGEASAPSSKGLTVGCVSFSLPKGVSASCPTTQVSQVHRTNSTTTASFGGRRPLISHPAARGAPVTGRGAVTASRWREPSLERLKDERGGRTRWLRQKARNQHQGGHELCMCVRTDMFNTGATTMTRLQISKNFVILLGYKGNRKLRCLLVTGTRDWWTPSITRLESGGRPPRRPGL